MIPKPTIIVEDRLTSAIRRLVDSRENKTGTAAAMDMSMQYWVSFVMAKQTVAGRATIRERLMARAESAKAVSPVRRFNKRGTKESAAKRYLQLRDTRAAAIVWATNYRNARSLPSKEFFSLVGRYIAARVYSSGYHKAGFRPALNAFKMRRGQMGVAPFYQHEKGSAFAARSVSDSILEALVENATAGVTKNPGGRGAPEAAKSEVIARLERFILQNLLERGHSLGFRGR